jgi:hypothetical protein
MVRFSWMVTVRCFWVPHQLDFAAYVESIEGLDEVSMGVFTVYAARPGDALQRLKGLVLRTGARFIAWHGYPRWNLGKGAHVLPAECMVRVR